MKDPLPIDALCERCYGPITPQEPFARLAHLVGSTLTGDTRWAYTYLHHFDVEARICQLPR